MALHVQLLKLIGQLYRLNDSLYIDLRGCKPAFGHIHTCIMHKSSFRDENFLRNINEMLRQTIYGNVCLDIIFNPKTEVKLCFMK